MNRTLIIRARTILAHAGLPNQFWQFAVATAAHVTNRLPTDANKRTPPYTLWTGRTPDVSHLRVFGCRAFAHITGQKRRKFDPKAEACIFLGYATHQKGYQLQEESTGKTFTSRDVTFHELVLPRKVPIIQGIIVYHDDGTFDDSPTTKENIEKTEENASPSEPPDSKAAESASIRKRRVSFSDLTSSSRLKQRTSSRMRSKPARFQHEQENAHAISMSRQTAHTAFMMNDPATYEEAVTRNDNQGWNLAMKQEYDSLIQNGTWSLEELPSGRKAIKSKWVFKTKTKPDGTVERYKARLVAQGFSQRVGIDFDDTFSPVATLVTFRIMIGLKAIGWHVRQLDVETAYLNANLDVDIYITQPQGFEINKTSNQAGRPVCKLHKAIYGLKQAGLAWFRHLSKILLELKFESSRNDACLFIKSSGNDVILLATYVDDLIISSRSLSGIIETEQRITEHLRVKLMGSVEFILGWKVQDANDGVIVTQSAYIRRVLKQFGMIDSHPVKTPSLKSNRFSKLVPLKNSHFHTASSLEAYYTLLTLLDLTSRKQFTTQLDLYHNQVSRTSPQENEFSDT